FELQHRRTEAFVVGGEIDRREESLNANQTRFGIQVGRGYTQMRNSGAVAGLDRDGGILRKSKIGKAEAPIISRVSDYAGMVAGAAGDGTTNAGNRSRG